MCGKQRPKSTSATTVLLQSEHGVHTTMIHCSIAHDFSKINGGLLQRMKERMSVHELCTYMTAQKPSLISYWSENQQRYSAAEPCKLKMVFSIMSIQENPNIILMESKDGNKMQLNMVQYIEIDEHSEVFPIIMTVFCGGKTAKNNHISYTFILS